MQLEDCPCVNSVINEFTLIPLAQLRRGQVRDLNIIYKALETKKKSSATSLNTNYIHLCFKRAENSWREVEQSRVDTLPRPLAHEYFVSF